MKNKKSKLKNIFITVFGLILLLILTFFYGQRGEEEALIPSISADSEIQSINASASTEPSPREEGNSDEGSRTMENISIPILMYHYVRTVDDPNDKMGFNLSVTPEKFAKDLDYIQSKGYTATNFYDIKNGKLPEKPVILTFDDGYQDFYTNAYPELRKRGMTAVSFVIADRLDGNYMTEQELREISDKGIEIGSHTLSHPDLTTLEGSKLDKEISQSKQKIEEIIGKVIISFCYPSGKFNEKASDSVGKAGYFFAVTTKTGISMLDAPLTLNRYRVNPDTNISKILK